MIGSFGDVIFETSDKKILTYKNFRRDGASRYSDHEVIGKKPSSEWLGPGNDTVSFEVSLNSKLGVDPDALIALFIKYNRDGYAFPLVIGPKTLGVDKWRMNSLGEVITQQGTSGEILSATLEISLAEYVEEA